MEPARQVEIQLGHMCNNRCVFCVSGQRTELGEAGPLDPGPALERISEAYAQGHRKITLLGGEPTLQPGFLTVVEHCVALGFEEIVIFTNGVRTARAEVVDAVLATGGRFTWRISIQGGTEEAHVRTTRKPRSFQRILRTLEHLRARDQRITVNMCVVESNRDSVAHFPEWLLDYRAVQLHLDMMRPLDAGDRSEAEMRAMVPRLGDLAAPMRAMIAGFEGRAPGFDVNIGNLPHCIAPDLAPWIHHDGESTDTIAIDGDDRLSKPWNKYLIKRRDKIKRAECRECVFDDACSGVFETYAAFYGTDELVPIDGAGLRRADPKQRLLHRHLRPVARQLRRAPAPFTEVEAHERSEHEVVFGFRRGDEVRATLRVVRDRGPYAGELARYGWCVVHGEGPERAAACAALHEALRASGFEAVHPLGPARDEDAPPTVRARLRRLRRAAPFVRLSWTATTREDDRWCVHLDADDGGRAVLWMAETERDGAALARGGYALVGEATEGLREGLAEVLAALRPKRRARAAP